MLIVACRLCVIDVRERFQCIGYDYTACMNYMDPMSAVPKRPLNFIITHSLSRIPHPPPTKKNFGF